MESPEVGLASGMAGSRHWRRSELLGLALSSASFWVDFSLGQAFHMAQPPGWYLTHQVLPSNPNRNTAVLPTVPAKIPGLVPMDSD